MPDRRLVVLTRSRFTPFGVFGELDTGTFKCPTLERPKEGEHPCIPPTDDGYDGDWTLWHPKHPGCYQIQVPGRSDILMHAANVFEQLLGCIAPGTKIENMSLTYEGAAINHLGVSGSGPALAALIADLGKNPFTLVIREVS